MVKIIILLYFYFCCAPMAFAQPAEEVSPANTEQWQLTFDVIKDKVKALMEENNQLTKEYGSLQTQMQESQRAMDDRSKENDAVNRFLKERNGRTDQQLRIEELASQIKSKKPLLAAHQQEANALKKRAADWQRKVGLMKLKITDLELHQNASAPPPPAVASSGDVELDGLRKDLEAQKAQEVALENQLALAHDRQHGAAADAQATDGEINALQQKLGFLQQQKNGLLPKVSRVPDAGDRGRYSLMARQKSQLESKIQIFEVRINALKDHGALATSWAVQKKQLIHDVVQADARNGQLRQKVNDLREDIALLRDQIASREKKLNFSQGKGKTR